MNEKKSFDVKFWKGALQNVGETKKEFFPFDSSKAVEIFWLPGHCSWTENAFLMLKPIVRFGL